MNNGGKNKNVAFIILFSINLGYLLFFETTIMGKTAHLAMARETNIDTLHKEVKSQKVITEGWLFTECCIKAC